MRKFRLSLREFDRAAFGHARGGRRHDGADVARGADVALIYYAGHGIEVGGTNYPAFFEAFARHGVTVTLNLRLERIRREGNRLVATLFNEYDKSRHERRVDQVVVERGTLPVDDLYIALKPGSRNLGEVDYDAWIANRPQDIVRNPAGSYALYRIGDAVASRNIHAAVYDGLRLAKDI